MQLFSAKAIIALKKLKKKFYPQKVKKKNTSKSCILMAVGSFFFSAAMTAKNSPELHFRLVNSFIQPSNEGSLHTDILGVEKYDNMLT